MLGTFGMVVCMLSASGCAGNDEQVMLAALDESIEMASAVDRKAYTASSLTKLVAALTYAEQVSADETASAECLEYATEKLNDARENLKPIFKPASYSELDYEQRRDDAASCEGEKAFLSGEVVEIVCGKQEVFLWIKETGSSWISVGRYHAGYFEQNPGAGDNITIYGTCAGLFAYDDGGAILGVPALTVEHLKMNI